jgi:hypothetical protein
MLGSTFHCVVLVVSTGVPLVNGLLLMMLRAELVVIEVRRTVGPAYSGSSKKKTITIGLNMLSTLGRWKGGFSRIGSGWYD